ncbi:fibronectin type III-like domain-contianing protein [Microbacterium sp. bgisy189]|uniref:fibronectin type III-like domain-contianing protein n=1 Tax=Microbacterium sp. bgisy189 TaxID=3413798 RepID=UPI003EB76935
MRPVNRAEATTRAQRTRGVRPRRRDEVAPGTAETVTFEVPVAACTIVDTAGDRIVEPGAFEMLVGPSSREEALLVAGFEVR